MEKKNIQVSVVTVVYQARDLIEKTIRSVYGQSFDLFEYIIIDGGSVDGTYDVICRYDRIFSEKGIPYIHISEPDSGIYDAMNKALNYCSGEWVYYLGANDEFYSPDTLKEVFSKSFARETAFFYGNVWRKMDGRRFFRPANDMKVIGYELPFCHQAVFVRSAVMRKYMFDCRYKLNADYDLFVRLFLDGVRYKKIDKTIAVFDLGGISQKQINLRIKEDREIWKKAGFLEKHKLKHFIRSRVILPLKKSKMAYRGYMLLMRCKYGKSGETANS